MAEEVYAPGVTPPSPPTAPPAGPPSPDAGNEPMEAETRADWGGGPTIPTPPVPADVGQMLGVSPPTDVVAAVERILSGSVLGAPTPEPAPPPPLPEPPVAVPGQAAPAKPPQGGMITIETETPVKRWYVVKVTSGREDTIKESIERRVKKDKLEDFFGQIVIPVEKYTEVKTNKAGKRVTRPKERKLYPGYLMVEVAYNDRILYLFRETSGVGDFVGAHIKEPEKPPTPMTEREVARMLGPMQQSPGEASVTVVAPPRDMGVGDRVRVVDGTFNGMEGTVKSILESQAKVQVDLTIFGRPVAVELEYYQVEQA